MNSLPTHFCGTASSWCGSSSMVWLAGSMMPKLARSEIASRSIAQAMPSRNLGSSSTGRSLLIASTVVASGG